MKLLRGLLLAVVLFSALLRHADAQVIQVTQFTLEASEEGHIVNANFELELTHRLQNYSGLNQYRVVIGSLT